MNLNLAALETQYGLPQGLLNAVMQAESVGNPNAVSPKGAQGLFQFMPATAKELGIDPLDPVQAAEGAAKYYGQLSQKYKGDVPSMLAAYNWGMGNVDRQGLDNAPAETQNYIQKVTELLGGNGSGYLAGGSAEDALAPEEQAELAALEAWDAENNGGLTPEEEAELADLEAWEASQKQPIADERPQSGLARTILEQGLQGTTANFSDEVTDPLGVVFAGLAEDPLGFAKSVLTGETPQVSDALSEEIANVRGNTEARLDRQFDDRPVASILANIGGALLTGGSGVSTKAGATVSNSLRSGNALARIAKGAAAGAGSSGLYALGDERGDIKQRVEKSGISEASLANPLVLGAAIGGGIPAAGNALSSANRALGRKAYVPNSDEIRQQAGRLYQQAEELGGVLKPEFTNSFVDAVEKLKPQTEIGKIVGGESPFTQAVERLSSIRGRQISLQAAQEIDELLGDAIDGFTDMGKLTKQGKKLLDIQTTFRNMIEGADESLVEGGKAGFDALKEGRKLWSTSRKLADIERIIARAELTDNPASAIKSGFRTLASNPNRLKGFNKAEREAIKNAAESGVATDLLRTFGSRLLTIGSALGGGGLGSTAATAAANMASRGAATKLQLNRAKNLADMVALQGAPSRTPLIRGSALERLTAPAAISPALAGNIDRPAPTKPRIFITPEE